MMSKTTVFPALAFLGLALSAQASPQSLKEAVHSSEGLVFNFGPEGVAVPVGVINAGSTRFDDARGWGWVQPAGVLRQREQDSDPLRDSFAAGGFNQPEAIFQVNLEPGSYLIETGHGDPDFAYRLHLFVGDEPQPWLNEGRMPAGTHSVRRHTVDLPDGILRLRLPSAPTAGTPFANLSQLRIFPADAELPPIPGVERRLVARGRSQTDLPGTPVAYTPGTMVPLSAITRSASEVYLLSDPDRPGMWCWFQDPRAIVDTHSPMGTMLLAGVVTYGEPGSDQRGDIDLYWANLDTIGSGQLESGRVELEDRLQMDDHASPGLAIRPDGRYLATWTLHGNTASPTFPPEARESVNMRWRISTHPGDPTQWQPMQKDDTTAAGLCYTHPFFLSEGDNGNPVFFNAVRSIGFDNHVLWSHDLGESWHHSGRLMDAPDPWPGDGNGGRAYVKYAGDGVSRVYILVTDDHPHVNFNDSRTNRGPYLNSIYAGYIEDMRLFDMEGNVVNDDLSDMAGTPPTALTVLLKDGTRVGDAVMRRGWQSDIRVMPDGNPVAIFQFRADDDKDDHRYFYARYDGERFHINFLAYAGSHFGREDQPDYAGLATVDAMNPDIVYISTDAHPVTGEELISTATGKPQFEIFMGRTRDQGANWEWTALTENSPYDNIRPFSPAWEKGRSAVVYMSGSYPSFYVYDNEVRLRVFDLD